MVNIVVPKENYLVTQSNELIDARYPTPLTLNEKKIVLMMISLIQPDDEDFKTYTLPVREYMRLLGLNENTDVYGYLRKLMRNLMQRVLEIPNGEDWKMVHWVSHCELVKKKGELSFTFHPMLKPYLLELKTFTQYRLKNVLTLTSVYSIAIYEIMKKWENSYNKTVEFDIEDFRVRIGATKQTYQQYAQLKRKILEPALAEINEKTDILFSYKPIKSGHKVSRLAFTIKKNPKNKPQKKIENTDNEYLYSLALKLKKLSLRFELDETLLEKLLKQGELIWKDDENIPNRFEKELIALCTYTHNQLKIHTPVGFIRKAFEKALTKEKPTFMDLCKTESIPDWFVLGKSEATNENVATNESEPTKNNGLDYDYLTKLLHKKLDGTITEEEKEYLESVTVK